MSEESRQAFAQIIEEQQPAIRELAWAARALIYEVMPQVVEVVWTHQKIAGYGTGPKKMSEQFSYISAHKGHVNLGFYYGSELPDPEGLLEGTGKLLRHVKLRTREDLERPSLRALLEAATRHRVPPPKPM